MMARNIFTVPVSTVPFESYFSSANKILIDKSSKFGVKIFERPVCLKDWFDAKQHNQHSPMESPLSGEFMTNADEDSDGILENDIWYMNQNF
jgi:hAT family C-terminal dimerisation region